MTHRDLIAAARRIRRAADDDDTRALHTQLCELRSILLDHLYAEHTRLDERPESASHVVRQGQRGLLRFLDDLIFVSADTPHGCACSVKVAQLEHRIRRQARLEAALLVTPRADLPTKEA